MQIENGNGLEAKNGAEGAKILLRVRPRGFCAGVVRAVDIVELALEAYGAPVYVHHEIVHNRYVVDQLRQRGAIFVESLEQVPVGAVLGYCNILFKLLQETEADHIAVVFDAARATFRDKIYDQYKANRPDPPDDLIPQFKLVREATDAFNVARIERADYEADDLIAAYAKLAKAEGATVTIVSSDKDLMQLVNDQVGMLDPIKQKPIGALCEQQLIPFRPTIAQAHSANS